MAIEITETQDYGNNRFHLKSKKDYLEINFYQEPDHKHSLDGNEFQSIDFEVYTNEIVVALSVHDWMRLVDTDTDVVKLKFPITKEQFDIIRGHLG